MQKKTINIFFQGAKHKAKRIRTTFTEEQTATLQVEFNLDSNPDGADLERIAQKTGLSKRVTQVLFIVFFIK
jgi:hypothetical protein